MNRKNRHVYVGYANEDALIESLKSNVMKRQRELRQRLLGSKSFTFIKGRVIIPVYATYILTCAGIIDKNQ